MSECGVCHHIVNAPVSKCPECDSENIISWSRIIGYLTAVKNWSSGRQKEFETRVFGDKDKYKKYKSK